MTPAAAPARPATATPRRKRLRVPALAEPRAKADRSAEQRPFGGAGDVARRLAEQQGEGVDPEQFGERPDDQTAERAADDAPRPAARGKPAAAIPRLIPTAPISAAMIDRLTSTSSTEMAPMPGWSGCEAPAKP